MPFAGLRVLSLESRRNRDMHGLIVGEGGLPFVAPSVREEAVDATEAVLRFVDDLECGKFDMLIAMAGAGMKALRDTCAALTPQTPIGCPGRHHDRFARSHSGQRAPLLAVPVNGTEHAA